MIKDRVGGAAIAVCAALGSAMAGVILGIVGSIGLLSPSAGFDDAVQMLAISVTIGAFIALLIGTPIGLAVGLIITRLLGGGTGQAALAGALTGATYPLFFLVSGFLMGASGLSGLTASFFLFGAIGAACGGASYWFVVGRRRQQG
jgi:hypothetical protein